MGQRPKHKSVDIAKAIELIGEQSNIPKRLERYKHWGEMYLSGKKRPSKKAVDKILLEFARDFKIWIIHEAMNHGDILALASLASEILDRYEDRPKISAIPEDTGDGVGNIILPPQKHLEIQDGETEDNLGTPPRATDRISE